MAVWRPLSRGLPVLVRQSAADRDIDEEVRQFLEEASAEALERGASPAEARRASRLAFGDAMAIREEVRSHGWEHIVDTALADLRHAVRGLGRRPGFAAVGALTLALGLGASTAIFSAVGDGVVRRRFGAAGRIVGRPVMLDGDEYTVIGVTPSGFDDVLSSSADVWAPRRYRADAPFQSAEWGHHMRMVGPLAPGVSTAQALGEIAAIGGTPVAAFPRPPWAAMAEGLDVESLQAAVTRAVRPALLATLAAVACLRNQPIIRVATMDALVAQSEAQRCFVLTVFEAFGLAALALAAIGVFGMMPGSVTERLRELGVRAALGASRGRLLVLVIRQGLTLAAAGIAGGLVGAVFLSGALRTLLFGVSHTDTATCAGAGALVLVVALVASAFPAWEGTFLYLRSLDNYEPTRVPGSAGASSPFFSPDGRFVAFCANGRLEKAPVAGGEPQTIGACRGILLGASWGPNGTIVYSDSTVTGLWQVSADGGTPTALTSPDVPMSDGHRFPYQLPNAAGILFSTRAPDGRSQLAWLPAGASDWQVVAHGDARFTGMKYLASGHLVFGQGSSIDIVPFDLATGSKRNRLTAAPAATRGRSFPTSWSAGGAAGNRIVFTEVGPNGTRDVLALSTADGEVTPLLATPAHEGSASVSPTGEWLAYVSDETGLDEVYVQPFLGAGRKERVSLDGGARRAGRATGASCSTAGVPPFWPYRSAQPAGQTWRKRRSPSRPGWPFPPDSMSRATADASWPSTTSRTTRPLPPPGCGSCSTGSRDPCGVDPELLPPAGTPLASGR